MKTVRTLENLYGILNRFVIIYKEYFRHVIEQQVGNRKMEIEKMEKNGFIGYLTREQAFKSTMSVFFSGLHFHEWNRPVPNLNSDCYNGFQFALNLLGTRKKCQIMKMYRQWT